MFAQDEGGEGLVGYADVQVNLKDINDNAPVFPQGVYWGNVTENGTAGMYLSLSIPVSLIVIIIIITHGNDNNILYSSKMRVRCRNGRYDDDGDRLRRSG